MLNFLLPVIYLVIGILAIILLLALFKKAGQKELAASPRYQWEKAVEEYGDPAIISLYQNAKSDEERAEIAAFVNSELTKSGDTAGNTPEENNTEPDIMGTTTVIPDLQRIALEDLAMEHEPQEETSDINITQENTILQEDTTEVFSDEPSATASPEQENIDN